MASSGIIALIFFIVAVILLIKFVKGAIKMLFIASAVLGLIFLVTGYNVYSDAQDFGSNWESGEKLFLLTEQGELITAMAVDPSSEEQFKPFTVEEFEVIQDYYNKKQYSKLSEDYYKIFMIDFNTFSDLEDITISKKSLSVETIKNIILSPTSSRTFAKEIVGIDMDVPGMDDQNVRTLLFGTLFASAIKEKGPLFIIEEVKKENIYVYPETAMFKTIRLVPISLIKKVFSESAEVAKEGATVAAEVVRDLLEN